jgi:hypothetical protein
MKEPLKCDDPRKLLTHAIIYLWTQWRFYELLAWQDAMSILHRMRHDVEEEEDALFLATLDVFLKDATGHTTPMDERAGGLSRGGAEV